MCLAKFNYISTLPLSIVDLRLGHHEEHESLVPSCVGEILEFHGDDGLIEIVDQSHDQGNRQKEDADF
jgi:hypothetical protein